MAKDHKMVVLDQVDPENSKFVYGKCAVCNEGIGGAETEEELHNTNFAVHVQTKKLKQQWG